MKTLNKIVLLSPGMDDSHSGPDTGWIEKLGTNLNLVLKKYTGDSLMTITAEYKEAADLLNKQVFLFIVMHESYSSSAKYMKFLEKISADDDLKVGYLVRIDSSVRIAGKVPEPVVNATSIDLFESSKEQVEGTWLDDESQVYWSRLLDLAAEVKAISESTVDKTEKSSGKNVYLAQAAADMGRNRDIIKRELLEYGFKVFPDTDLRIYKSNLKSEVQKLTDRSRLVIHLLGNAYGESMKESGNSLAEVQVQYITEYLEAIENDPVHAEKEINRLVWIDPEFNPVDSQQEELINQLKRNIENLNRTEIIQTPLELFKTLVVKRLRQDVSGVSMPVTDDSSEGGIIYVIHSPDDQQEAAELAKGLSKGGLRTGMLDYGRKQKHLLNDHKSYLRACDGAIIYYGNPNRPWLRSKVMDLLKAPGLGRAQSLTARRILTGKKDELEDFSLPGEITITKETDMSKAVSQLLKTLKQ